MIICIQNVVILSFTCDIVFYDVIVWYLVVSACFVMSWCLVMSCLKIAYNVILTIFSDVVVSCDVMSCLIMSFIWCLWNLKLVAKLWNLNFLFFSVSVKRILNATLNLIFKKVILSFYTIWIIICMSIILTIFPDVISNIILNELPFDLNEMLWHSLLE